MEVFMSKLDNYEDILRIKHTFLTSKEKSYFLELLKNPAERNIHLLLRDINAEFLFEKAQDIISQIEIGAYNQQQLQVAQYKLIHCLAAIGEVQGDNTLYVQRFTLADKNLNAKRQQSKFKVAEQLMERSLANWGLLDEQKNSKKISPNNQCEKEV